MTVLPSDYIPHAGRYIVQNLNSEDDGLLKGQLVPISFEEFQSLERCSKVLQEFILIHRKFKEVLMNYQENFECIKFWEEKLSHIKGDISVEIHNDIYIDVNRRFTNFVTSLNSFIYDLILKSFIPRTFGKKSDEVEQFTKQTRSWFDGCFEYRFLMRMRDYAVHVDHPINSVTIDVDFDENRDPKRKDEIIASFNRDKLLNDRKNKSALELDLSLRNKKFPVLPLLRNSKKILDEVYDYVIRFLLEGFRDCIEYLQSWVNRFDNPVNVSFGFVSHAEGLSTTIINREVLNELTSRLSQVNRI